MITLIKNVRLNRRLGTMLIMCSLFSTPVLANTEATDQQNEDKKAEETTLTSIDKNAFEYQLEGRPDPFMPFLSPKVTTNIDPNEIISSGEILTGMQLFEPGQLTLVAIMQISNAYIAMVEDSTGKGYVLRQGIKIGEYGEITNIDSNRVYIIETKTTRAKKIIQTKIDMVLKTEGEE